MNEKKFVLKDKSKFIVNSYSQLGEDLVLKTFLERDSRINMKKGFYVDIGAHHPYRFSNTQIFSELGWTGINVDPMPGIMEIFNEARPNDINIESGISTSGEPLTYYMFSDHAINGFSKEFTEKLKEWMPDKKYLGEKIVQTYTLETLLDKYLPDNTQIDFLNIDVEEYDFDVLESNNWNKYKPRYILIEMHGAFSLESLNNSRINNYLKQFEYELVAKTYVTSIFMLKNK